MEDTKIWLLLVALSNGSVEDGELFSLKIFQNAIRNSQRNAIFSVGGLLESLAVLYEASGGASSTILARVAGFSSKDDHRSDYAQYKQSLMNSAGPVTSFIQRSIIFQHESITVYESFRRIIQDYFQCNMITVPKSFSEGDELHKIHHEIDFYTNHTLDKSTFDDVLSSLTDTELMLISVNYFKSGWETVFDPLDTEQRNFYNIDGSTRQVPFMESTGRFKAVKVSQLRSTLLQLPYKDSAFSLLVLLPDENTNINSILDSFDWTVIRNFIPNDYAPMNIRIPKFKINSNIEMNEHLIQSGLSDLFKSLDLVHMTPEKELSLSSIYQVAHFEIDEVGTMASSSIHMSIGFRSLQIPKIVEMNRPFLYFIINSKVFSPIYLGKVIEL
ncbi:antichymotrypsin-2-like [Chrysoperla carnea]|uniref:antichymotrypsin-2-like n=1 Tax=Chrysoperla carnea TaxID=189513 RepID=UPI001D078F17|nr:antichymotrypsin-2-like [Chrysoperla carnea]